MYIGNKHTSTNTATEIFDFSCNKCGHSCKAVVTGVGQGQGNSPYFMDESGATKRAEKQANKNAVKNIAETMLLATCPKCNRRNESDVSKFKQKQILKLAGGMGLFFGVGALVYMLVDEEFVIMLFGGLGLLLLPLMYYMDIHWRWKTAKDRIQFVEE